MDRASFLKAMSALGATLGLHGIPAKGEIPPEPIEWEPEADFDLVPIPEPAPAATDLTWGEHSFQMTQMEMSTPDVSLSAYPGRIEVYGPRNGSTISVTVLGTYRDLPFGKMDDLGCMVGGIIYEARAQLLKSMPRIHCESWPTTELVFHVEGPIGRFVSDAN